MKQPSTTIVSDYSFPSISQRVLTGTNKQQPYLLNKHTDNKENSGPYQTNKAYDTFKKPYPLAFKGYGQVMNSNRLPNKYAHVIPLKTNILANIDIKKHWQEQKLQNQDSKNMTANVNNKREEKQTLKDMSKLSKIERGNQPEINKDTFEEVPSQILEVSRIQDADIINNKLFKESDSQMDHTFQSANSLLNGVQFQGRWTLEEHQKFVEGLKQFGKDWKKIEDYIGSRTCAQIRSHAQKYFNRLQRERSKNRPQELQQKKTLDVKNAKQQNAPKSSAIQSSTNRQLQQISETFSKLAEEDLHINLQQLLTEREYISEQLIAKFITPQEACEMLIILTNSLHQLSLQALANSKIELYQRLIDERNLTQLICILLSQQVLVMPDQDQKKISTEQLTSILSPYLLKDSAHLFGFEQRDTARTSPRNEHSTCDAHDHSPHMMTNQNE